jgi:Flp pilus assembly protein TadD
MKLHTRSLPLALCLLALGLPACFGPAKRDPSEIARTYLEAERFGEAVREIELAVRKQPKDVDLRLEAAEIHALAGQLQQAIDHLESAQNLSPGSAEAVIRLGELEQRRGNATDAYVAFRQAVNLAPDDVRAISGLALSAEALGFDDEAAQAYERWEDLDGGPAAPAAE